MSKAAHRMSGLPVESREKAIKEHHLLPFLALDTIFSILILSQGDLRFNRKPCQCCAVYTPFSFSGKKFSKRFKLSREV